MSISQTVLRIHVASSSSFRRPRWVRPINRWALTLLELLVVLVILAIMATIAIQSIQPRVDNARLEATRKSLEQVVRGVIGMRGGRQSDGTPMLDGFVADVGRLPKGALTMSSDNPADSGARLDELWNPQSEIAMRFPFAFRSGPQAPVDFREVRLACGWRGPYLMLPLGANRLVDGWGRPFQFEAGPSGEIQQVSSEPMEPILPEPLTAAFSGGKVTVTGTLVESQATNGEISVALLAPDPQRSLDELAVFDDEDGERLFFQFSNVPIGLRAIVVMAGTQRTIHYVQVPHSGLNLTLQIQKSDTPNVEERESTEIP